MNFMTLAFFDRPVMLQNVLQFNFIWGCLMSKLKLCIFGEKCHRSDAMFFSLHAITFSFVYYCVVNFDYLIKVVSDSALQ